MTNLAPYFLKWLEATHPAVQGENYTLIRNCVLTCVDPSGHVTGFTAFEPRDFTEAFLKRLDARRNRALHSGNRFCLYLPRFLKHRCQTLGVEAMDIEIRYSHFVKIRHRDHFFELRDRIRIVNVDDSPVLLKVLKHSLESLGYVDVVAQISEPLKAVSLIRDHQPDIVTMDIQMPEKTGVEVVKELLAKTYFPVLMISSVSLEEGSLVFQALNAGAFDYLQKPSVNEKEMFAQELEEKILTAVQGCKPHSTLSAGNSSKATSRLAARQNFSENLIWCLGASTGGTQALTRVFTSLPDKIPPTLVVQHMPPVFSRAFAESLNELCPFIVKEAEHGESIVENHVYIAAGGLQMGVERKGHQLFIKLSDDPPVNRFKPSVDFLFGKMAELVGYQIVAGILTGMGKDGAQGLLTLRKNGARTFAQDEKTSAVYGMPREALEVGAAECAIALDSIAQKILDQSVDQVRPKHERKILKRA